MSQLVLQYHNKYRLTHAHRSKGPLAMVLGILDGARYDEDSDMIALLPVVVPPGIVTVAFV